MTKRRRRKDDDERDATSTVDWGSFDEEAAETFESESDSTSVFDALEDGDNYRRILPPPKGSGWGKDANGDPKDSPLLTVWEHIIEVQGEDKPLSFSCPKKMLGEPCFACDHSDKHIRSPVRSEKEIGFNYRAARKVYLQWFDSREYEDGKPEIKVYRAGKLISNDLADCHAKYGDFSHAKSGYEIKIVRTGKGKDTRYRARSQDTLPLADFELTPDDLIDLTQYIRYPSPEEQAEMVEQLGLHEEREPRRVPYEALASRRTRRRSKTEDDGGRLKSRDTSSSDEEDRPPSRRSRRGVRNAVDEGDSDQVEKRPRRRRRRPS